jgi:hypothetical protein
MKIETTTKHFQRLIELVSISGRINSCNLKFTTDGICSSYVVDSLGVIVGKIQMNGFNVDSNGEVLLDNIYRSTERNGNDVLKDIISIFPAGDKDTISIDIDGAYMTVTNGKRTKTVKIVNPDVDEAANKSVIKIYNNVILGEDGHYTITEGKKVLDTVYKIDSQQLKNLHSDARKVFKTDIIFTMKSNGNKSIFSFDTDYVDNSSPLTEDGNLGMDASNVPEKAFDVMMKGGVSEVVSTMQGIVKAHTSKDFEGVLFTWGYDDSMWTERAQVLIHIIK